MDRLLRAVRRAILTSVLALAGLYAADWLSMWVRSGRGGDDGALGSVTYYVVAPLKSGKSEIYFDQPQTEICVHALFPHRGYRPCWYADRDRFHSA